MKEKSKENEAILQSVTREFVWSRFDNNLSASDAKQDGKQTGCFLINFNNFLNLLLLFISFSCFFLTLVKQSRLMWMMLAQVLPRLNLWLLKLAPASEERDLVSSRSGRPTTSHARLGLEFRLKLRLKLSLRSKREKRSELSLRV